MDVIKPIIGDRNNIEIYGKISHDHGITEYNALNTDGIRFTKLLIKKVLNIERILSYGVGKKLDLNR